MQFALSVSLIFNLLSIISYAQTDQELVWASYFGGTGNDQFYSVSSTLNSGFLFVGQTSSTFGLTTIGAHQGIYGGGSTDGAILKTNAANEIEWCTYFGGSQFEVITDIGVFADGSFVIVGFTGSAENIATEGAFIETYTAGSPAFVSMFSADGNQLWGTYLDGGDPGTTVANSVCVNSEGRIAVCGYTAKQGFPVTTEAHQTVFGGQSDGFLTVLDDTGNVLWSTFYGGDESDEITDVQFTSSHDIIALGLSKSTENISFGDAIHQTTLAGEYDAFLARFTEMGELLWATYYGGEGLEQESGPQGLVLDDNDNIFIRINTMSESGISTPGAHRETLDYTTSAAFARFTSTGQLDWSTYFGNNSTFYQGGAIACFNDEIVYAGVASFEEGYLLGNAYQTEFLGGDPGGDIYLAGFSPSGEQQWGTFYGGTGADGALHLEPMDNHQFVLAGVTRSDSNLGTENGFQPNFGGGQDDGLAAIFDISNVTASRQIDEVLFSAFPNPTTSHIRLQLPPLFAFQADVTIYNTTGQAVARHENFDALQPLQMPATPGLYLVECRNGNRTARARVVVE